MLVDLDSRNGTAVNGVPIDEEVEVVFGDRITLGANVILLLTQHDQLKEDLVHRQRMEAIGRLAGGIAHDFNNLVGSILGNIVALRGLAPGDFHAGDSQEMLRDIEKAAKRAASLTRQLLSFARRASYEARPVNLSTLCQEVVRMSRSMLGPNIEVVLDIDSGIIVAGDSSHLHQVFMNLFINARDAMPKGGRILVDAFEDTKITLSGVQPKVIVSVSDTGSGMSDETRSHAFDPFFTTKPRGRGTGLGLATVYGIIRSHGGDISIESQLGKGCKLTISLPAPSPNIKTTSSIELTADVEERNKGTVLVVDDDELFLKSTARMLRRCGYGVCTAASGQEAVDLFQRDHSEISVVLLDVVMPGMDVKETVHALREIDPNVSVVVMSGYHDSELPGVLLSGPRGILSKPFDRERLEEHVKSAIRGSQGTYSIIRSIDDDE